MSSPTLFLSPSPSPSLHHYQSTSRSVQRHTPHRDHTRPDTRPRLSSQPRLFADFFTSAPEPVHRRTAVLPPARRSSRAREGTHSFTDAIQRTTRAMRSTGEAFQSGAGPSRSEVVDLTDSPPAENRSAGRQHSRDGRDSDFAITTHPQDSRRPGRGLSTMHEPIFGYAPIFAPAPPREDPSDSLVRARNRRARIVQPVHNQAARRQADERAEREAIRRQRENHQAWQQTQERRRRLLEQQEDLEQISSRSPTPTPSSDSIFGDSRNPTPDTMPSMEKIESVDLTGVNDEKALHETLAKQQADTILSQNPNTSTDAGRTTFTAYKCPICMDNIKDATTTICGHLFCHRCIVDTLNWSATQRKQELGSTRKVNGVCPVCRKSLANKDSPGTQRTLVTLELKFLTKKRKRDDKGKGRADDYQPRSKAKRPKRETSEDFFNSLINNEYEG